MKTEKKVTIWELILLFSAFYLPGYLIQGGSVDPAMFNYPLFHLTYFITSLPQIALLFFILYLRRGGTGSFTPVCEQLSVTPVRISLLWQTMITLGGLAVIAVAGGMIALIPGVMESESLQPVQWELYQKNIIPLVLLTCLITGYREEIFFRAYLLMRFEDLHIPKFAGILLSSVIFALGHIYQGIPAAFVTFCIGMYLGFLYFKFRNLHMIAIGHGLYNFLSLLFFQGYDNFFIYGFLNI